ncbi:MAG: hypothetical protein ACRCTR_08415 [Actinomycetota bacterium]
MPLFRRGSDDEGSTEPKALSEDERRHYEDFRSTHVLVVPDSVLPQRVDGLISYRYADTRLTTEGWTQLGRNSAISGPHLITGDEARDIVGVPEPWRTFYALHVEPDHDPSGFAEIMDPTARAWWMRAFPEGMPLREEARVVDLAMEVARRTGGSIRVASSGALMRPDPFRLYDLIVWSHYWLNPHQLFELLSPILPGAYVPVAVPHENPLTSRPDDQPPWASDLTNPDEVNFADVLSDEDRALIAYVAEQHEAAAAATGGADGYSLCAEHDLTVEVTAQRTPPDWVQARVDRSASGHSRTEPLISYTVRWLPDDQALLESEEASREFKLYRDRVRTWQEDTAVAVAEVTAGVISDAVGFEVDRYLGSRP